MELVLAILLAGIGSRLLLPGAAGEPILRNTWGLAVSALATLLGLGLYIGVRRRQIRHPTIPVVGAVVMYSLASLALYFTADLYESVVWEWNISEAKVVNLLSLDSEGPSDEAASRSVRGPIDEAALREVQGPIHVERRGPAYLALVLVPPRRWWSQRMRDYVERRKGIQGAFDIEGVWFVQSELAADKRALRLTKLAFLGLYFAAVACLAIGHACTITAIERSAARAPDIQVRSSDTRPERA